VDAGPYRRRDEDAPFSPHHGSAFWAVYDLADLERSVFVLSTGQAGNPLSPGYRDLAPLWRDVRYIPMTMERKAIEQAATARLDLVPADR
jgi:penicillin amidase